MRCCRNPSFNSRFGVMGSSARKSDRSSSITSSPPKKSNESDYNCRKKRKNCARSSSDDDSRHHKQKTSGIRNYKKQMLRRKNSSSSDDFEDHHPKNSKNRYNMEPREKRHSKRATHYDTKAYRHQMRPKNRRYSTERTSKRASSEDNRHRMRPISEYHRDRIMEPKGRTSKTRASSVDSKDSGYHKFPDSVIRKQNCMKMDSDIEILKESKQPEHTKSKCRPKEFSKMEYCYYKSGKYVEFGRLRKALKYINMAHVLCEENDNFLSKIFTRRGNILSEMDKPRCSFQGFINWERAFMLDADNKEAQKNMSEVLFMGANKLYRMKAYENALVPAENAYKLDKNRKTYTLLKVIKKKLLEKEIEEERSSLKRSKYKIKRIPQRESKHEKPVLDEIERLNMLTAKALEMNNFQQALIFVKQALRLYKGDIPDDNVFHKLFVLKEGIMNMTP